ncbi:MAG TPA: MBL fold metallo-hydrolase [Candidatus Peribacteraceae bacterium]|nr:MBL fold metallo-hydrolase [Candidatus Peribacteraceae bacterium]
MLTFTALGPTTVRLQHPEGGLVVFPTTKGKSEDLQLREKPDDEPAKGTVSWPGEYDIKGVAIRGIGHDEGAIVSYAVNVDGTRCAFLSSPLRDWSDHELELLGDIDVLAIPTGDPKIFQKLVDEIDPRVLIPLTAEGGKQAECLKISGAQGVEAVKEYKIKGGLPTEGREVVLLEVKK